MPFDINPRYVIIGVVGLVVIVILIGLLSGSKEQGPAVSGDITMWGYWPQSMVSNVLSNFSQTLPVRVNYQELPREGYEEALVNALAAGQGPDIFMLKSSSRIKNLSKMSPAPVGFFTSRELRETFPDSVLNDFYLNNQLYALPVTFNPLTLFYNKEYFNAAGIAIPPKTWSELQRIVPKLTQKQGSILIRGGVALGTANNISYPKDILIVHFLQKNSDIQNLSVDVASAIFNYYFEFSDPTSPSYSWNNTFENDIESFAQGKVAIIFAYPSDIAKITNLNPRLPFDVAPLPQYDVNKPVNFTDYSVLAVSRLSRNQAAAWSAIKYMVNPQVSYLFANAVHEPPAQRQLLGGIQDPLLSVFASEILTSKNWLDPDPKETNRVFANAINDYLTGRRDLIKVVTELQASLNRLQRGQL